MKSEICTLLKRESREMSTKEIAAELDEFNLAIGISCGSLEREGKLTARRIYNEFGNVEEIYWKAN